MPGKRGQRFIYLSMFCMLVSVVALTCKAYEANRTALRVEGLSGVGENTRVETNTSGVGANALDEIEPYKGGHDAAEPDVGGDPENERDRVALERWKQWPDWAPMLAHPNGQFYYKQGHPPIPLPLPHTRRPCQHYRPWTPLCHFLTCP